MAIVMDAYSRRIIGWAVERTLQTILALQALRMALQNRGAPSGLVHHSDRGVQYACAEYVECLQSSAIEISRSRKGTPWDNAKAESFMKTLKAEAVDGRRFRDLEDAKEQLGAFMEEHYNTHRPHSALGYRSPLEFEQALAGKEFSKA